jgi:hypothetical protein
MMYIIANQLERYNNAQSDFMTYAMSAMTSNNYIELLPAYSNILYPPLYEELKTLTPIKSTMYLLLVLKYICFKMTSDFFYITPLHFSYC